MGDAAGLADPPRRHQLVGLSKPSSSSLATPLWNAPKRWAKLTGNVPEFGGIPKHDLAGFLIGDLLIHCWDLAHSIGADDTLPPAAVEATTMGLHHAPEPLLRGTNPLGTPMMAAAVEVPSDAGAQDKMIAYTGRRP